MTKKVTINVRMYKNGEVILKEVDDAEEIKIDCCPAERFFVHKAIDIKGWTLTESKTGLAVVRDIRTRSECIEKAKTAIVDWGVLRFLGQIDVVVEKYGYANEEVRNGQIN